MSPEPVSGSTRHGRLCAAGSGVLVAIGVRRPLGLALVLSGCPLDLNRAPPPVFGNAVGLDTQ